MIANIKLFLIMAAIGTAIWFYKDYTYQKAENKRQTENIKSLRKADSLKFSTQILSKQELIEELEYTNKDLLKKLKNDNIKLNRIEQIITQRLNYRDTVRTVIQATGLVKAVQTNTPFVVEVLDSTKCLLIKALLVYDGKEIDLQIKDRKFNNVTDVVAYWERNQWKILGIKTRVFGKKQATVKVYNSCGESVTKIIEKK